MTMKKPRSAQDRLLLIRQQHLRSAVVAGDVARVRDLVETGGVNVNQADEYGTSKNCCGCHTKLDDVFLPVRGKDEPQKIHALKRCTNDKCYRKRLNRDVNAVVNFAYLYLRTVVFGLEREKPFGKSAHVPVGVPEDLVDIDVDDQQNDDGDDQVEAEVDEDDNDDGDDQSGVDEEDNDNDDE